MSYAVRTLLLLIGLLELGVTANGYHIQKPRILGGRDTNITEVPWQLMQYKNGSFNCGAVIIGPREILSAGHCFLQNDVFYQVRAGSDQFASGGKNYTIEHYVVNPGFNISQPIVTHDIAFARVKEPFEFSESVQPIKRAEIEPTGGEEALISGFGLLWFNDSDPNNITGELPKVLQSVNLTIINRETCRDWYSDYEWNVIDDDQVCVGVPEGGHAANHGDSGGPLVVNGELVGVTSWGDPYGSPHHPSVYTSVVHYKDWINEQINSPQR